MGLFKRLFGLVKEEEVVVEEVKNSKERLLELVKSERYKESNYKIQRINNEYYVLFNTDTDRWVDLKAPSHEHDNKSTFFSDCKGTLDVIMKTFDDFVPYIETIESIETITEKSETMNLLIKKL